MQIWIPNELCANVATVRASGFHRYSFRGIIALRGPEGGA